MDKRPYPKSVFWSDEDEGFIAIAPDLPGSSAFGETEATALSQLDLAIAAWIDAATLAGNPIPEPSDPAHQHFSGRILLRLSKYLHQDLAATANAQGVSLNHWIVTLLSGRNACAKISASPAPAARAKLSGLRA